MGTGKTYSTKYLLDSNNSSGVAGQVLSTTSTGIDWVDANTVPGTGLWLTSGNNIYNSNSGNVGIGTTNPTHKLTVNAPNDTTAVGIDFPSAHFDFSANSTSGYTTSFHMDDTATTIGSNSAGRALKFQTNNTDRLYINGNTGNVGIGVTNPQDFNSEANNLVIGTGSGAEGMTIYGGSSGGSYIYFADGTSGSALYEGFLQYRHSERAMRFGVATGVRMTLEANGYLGIGTTSPGTALQVGGLDDGSNYDITVGWNAVSSQAVGTKRSALTFKTSQTGVNNEDIYKWDIAMVTAPATASNEPFGSNLAFLRSTRGSTSVDETTMILTQLGNVGIGTTSPGAKLQVYSTATRDISIFGHGTQAQNNWQAEHAFFTSAGQGVIIG